MTYTRLKKYKNFLDFLNQSGYSDSASKQKESLDLSLKNTLSELENQKKQISQASEDMAREAYISYVSAKKDLPVELAAKGLNGGAADNVYLSLANEYQNNYNKISRDKENKIFETDQAINKAKNSNDEAYSKALSDIYSSAVDNYLKNQESEEKMNFDAFYKDKELQNAASDREQKIKEAQKKEELEKAKLALQVGDTSFLEKLGIKPQDIIVNGGTSNGSSSSTGNITPDDAADLNRLLQYAVSLAEYGNYDLLCRITGISKEEAALRFAEKNTGYSDKQITEVVKLFMKGDYSNNVVGMLRQIYPDYSLSQIWNLWSDVAVNDWGISIDQGYKGP